MNDETGQKNNRTGKYIIELSKLKHLQCYTTKFELEFINIERKPIVSNKFHFIVVEVFETLETLFDAPTTTYYSTMIKPSVSKNFGNYYHHQNGTNQHQHVNQHTGQNYQSRSYQISRNFLSPYLKENCLSCGLNNKKVR